MIDYHCQRIPVSVYIPGMLKDDYSDIWGKTSDPEEPPAYPLLQRHSEEYPSQLTLTEPSFEELDLPDMTLEEYAQNVISTNRSFVPDFEVISANTYDIADNFTVAIIIFSSEGGQRVFHRLIYIDESGYIINLTYTYYPDLDDISDMIDYSFSSFRRE